MSSQVLTPRVSKNTSITSLLFHICCEYTNSISSYQSWLFLRHLSWCWDMLFSHGKLNFITFHSWYMLTWRCVHVCGLRSHIVTLVLVSNGTYAHFDIKYTSNDVCSYSPNYVILPFAGWWLREERSRTCLRWGLVERMSSFSSGTRYKLV